MTEKQVERLTHAAKVFADELLAVAAELEHVESSKHLKELAGMVVKATMMSVLTIEICGRMDDKENKADENGPQA